MLDSLAVAHRPENLVKFVRSNILGPHELRIIPPDHLVRLHANGFRSQIVGFKDLSRLIQANKKIIRLDLAKHDIGKSRLTRLAEKFVQHGQSPFVRYQNER